MDRIALRSLRAHGRHGANPGEREAPQPFDVDVSFDIDLRAAQASDVLEDTVNYAEIHARLKEIVEGESYALLERLAGRMIDELFRDARIAAAELTIGKPGLLDGATPSVTLVRKNPRYRSVEFP